MASIEYDKGPGTQRELVKVLDTVGWGLFFIWVGIAFLAPLSWGAGLLGVGVIALGVQGVRRYLGIPVEGFGLMIGLCFALAGVWDLLDLRLGEGVVLRGLVPAASILVGVLLVVSAWRHRRKQ
jgi:hypothetical protein